MAIFALKNKDQIKVTKELPIVLESLAVVRKGSGKAKAKQPVTFELETISAAGREPKLFVHGDEQKTIKKNKNEVTYIPPKKVMVEKKTRL
jgi:hypothetical protein